MVPSSFFFWGTVDLNVVFSFSAPEKNFLRKEKKFSFLYNKYWEENISEKGFSCDMVMTEYCKYVVIIEHVTIIDMWIF